MELTRLDDTRGECGEARRRSAHHLRELRPVGRQVVAECPGEEILHSTITRDRRVLALRLQQLTSGRGHLLLELLDLLNQLYDGGDIDDRELGLGRPDARERQHTEEKHTGEGFQ